MRALTISLLISLLAAVCAMALYLGGCTKKADHDLQPVTYRLKWLFNTSVVGDLYADVHGMFAEESLQVTIKEGGPERDAIKELELGHAQFGVASADQVIRAVSKGGSDCSHRPTFSGKPPSVDVQT